MVFGGRYDSWSGMGWFSKLFAWAEVRLICFSCSCCICGHRFVAPVSTTTSVRQPTSHMDVRLQCTSGHQKEHSVHVSKKSDIVRRRTDGRCGSRRKIQVAIHPELLRQRQLQQLPRQLETWTDHGLGSHLLQCTA